MNNLSDIESFIDKRINIFFEEILNLIRNLTLSDILININPYLVFIKSSLIVGELIKNSINHFLLSQEETIFGNFMEDLAIFVCNKVYGAKKSELTGIDLEFERDGIIYIVEIKAGWNWGNSSQIKQMKINFNNAKNLLEKQTGKQVIAVNGCCFGKLRKIDKGAYLKLCGQRFWELISGNEQLYIDIIEPIGHKAREKNEEFINEYSRILNIFTLEFSKEFCDDGFINWEKLLQFNSGK